jgi:DNA-binding LacI/PurR family transcriptional regulator
MNTDPANTESRIATKRPTIKDVAQAAGISRATVSYVINDKSGGNVRISDDTRQRVWEAVRLLGYKPSLAARALRTNRSNLVALMVPHIRTPFHPLLASAIQSALDDQGLDLIVYGTQDDPKREHDFVNNLIGRGVDGVILQSNHIEENELESLVNAGVGVVAVGNSPTHPYVDNVVFDEARAVEEVITYLAGKGHRRIALIAGPESTWSGRLRLEGYKRGVAANGLEDREDLIVDAEFFDGETATTAMQLLLALPEPPTAVFASNDLLAVNALLYALDHGVRVPQDIAVVGFNDTPEACLTRPRLTTVRKDIELLGRQAVRLLVERLENPERVPPTRTVMLDYELIYRESA